MNTLIRSACTVAAIIAASGVQSAKATEILTVRAKPPQGIELGEAIPISVSVGATAASGVKAGTVNLNLKGNGRSIAPQGLTLCETPTPCSGKPLSLPANTTYSLWLHGAAREGVYEGTVQIDHADNPAGNALLATTIYGSSNGAKAIGVALIAISVVFAFFFTVVLRHFSNRKSLLIAAGVAREEVYALQARLCKLTPPIQSAAQATENQLNALLSALEVRALEHNGLPASWATPLTDASLAAYRAYVSAQALKAQGVKVVIEEGLFEIEALFQGPNGLQLADARRALADVQGAARYANAVAPTEEVVRQAVQAAVKSLVASARNMTAAQWTPVGNGASGARQLQLQVANLNMAMWVAVLLLTTGVGAAVLVLTGPTAAGFGTLEDYVRCVTWGLGLSAGTQLTSVSTSTVTATFGVPKPL